MTEQRENVDLVRASYEAFERGDREGALAHVYPDVEWHQAQGLCHGGVYNGPDDVRRYVFDSLERPTTLARSWA